MNYYAYADDMMKTARSRFNGKPVANNTRLYQDPNGDFGVVLHSTRVVTLHEDGTATLNSGGWRTPTTADRIRSWSNAKLFSESNEWYVWIEPNPKDPKPTYVSPAVPAPYERPADCVQPDGYYGFYERYHTERKQRIHDEMMERFGTVEAWRQARKEQFAARRAYLKADREWTERNRVPFFDGITVNKDGYAAKLRADGPSPARLRRHEREMAKMKERIEVYLNGYMQALKNGMPMPSGGDCWYCSMIHAIPSRESEQSLQRGESMRPPSDESIDHLVSHMDDEYYVPSLAVNALRERGYRDVGVYIHLGMDHENGTMGGDKFNVHGSNLVKKGIRSYLRKRLIRSAPTE